MLPSFPLEEHRGLRLGRLVASDERLVLSLELLVVAERWIGPHRLLQCALLVLDVVDQAIRFGHADQRAGPAAPRHHVAGRFVHQAI